MAKHKIYLDYAAATPLDEKVFKAMQPYFTEKFYNPSALYLSAKSVSKDISDARDAIAKQLGVKPGELIFTAGGTEANNLAIFGIMRQYPDANVVTSSLEHDSVLKPASNFRHKSVKSEKNGIINTVDLKSKIDNQTVLVSVMYANNEIGTIQPINEVSKIIKVIRQQRKESGNILPLYLHTDAAQATNYLDVNPNKLGVDLMTINGGKIYGPKQSGVLYKSKMLQLQPIIFGGGQERGLRSGTENIANIIGFSAALSIVSSRKKLEVNRLAMLQQKFTYGVIKINSGIQINGSYKHRLPNIINVMFPNIDNERLVMELDERGVMCASGSACSTSNDEPSHVLSAIGLKKDQINSSVRFSLGIDTTEVDIDKVINLLKEYC